MSAEDVVPEFEMAWHERCSFCARKETAMHPDVQKARVNHLMAEMALEIAIRKGASAEVVPLAEHKADCADKLIKIINNIDPTYFDLPRAPCERRRGCA